MMKKNIVKSTKTSLILFDYAQTFPINRTNCYKTVSYQLNKNKNKNLIKVWAYP